MILEDNGILFLKQSDDFFFASTTVNLKSVISFSKIIWQLTFYLKFLKLKIIKVANISLKT